MAIRYVNKPKPAPAPAPAQAPKAVAGKKFSLKGKPAPAPVAQNLGGFQILKDMNLTVEKGGPRKFLVHRTKPGVWYEVVAFDDYSKQTDALKLRSPAGLVFDSKTDITTPQKYAVVVGPVDLNAPSVGVMNQVRFGSA